MTNHAARAMLGGVFHSEAPLSDALIPAWLEGRLVPMDKLEVHRRGLRHPAVSVFVVEDGKVLIQRRAAGKYHSAGLWANTVCTHPHWNEPPDRAARRRLREELGITGVYPAFAQQVEYRADVGNGLIEHEVVDVYLAFAPPGMVVTPNPEEVSETRWVGLYDLAAQVQRHPERFSAWLRIYLTKHMNAIFGAMPRS